MCVIDANSAVVAEAKVASDPQALGACLGRWSGSLVQVGQEAGGLSPWLHAGLAEQGLPAFVWRRAG